MKKCPFCAETIQKEAVKCRFCGEKLDATALEKEKEGVIVLRRFKSTALKDGKKCRGIFEARDREDAKKKLREQGYEVVTLREAWSLAYVKEKLGLSQPKIIKLIIALMAVLISSIVFVVVVQRTQQPALKPALSLEHYEFSDTLKEYSVIGEKTINYKEIRGDLSSYSVREIQSFPFILKKELKVVSQDISKKEDAENISKDIVNKKLKQDSDIDEIVISLYADAQETKGAYKLAEAVWAVEGTLGAITETLEKNNDKSRHEIAMRYNEAAFAPPPVASRPLSADYQSSDSLNPAQVAIVKFYMQALREHPELTEQIISMKVAEAYNISLAELKAMLREYMDGDYE